MRIIQLVLIPLVGLLSLPHTFSQYLPKPWPTYSLDNMPRTGFSCQGKILGGYYADPETQCQMFHVCVKVAGVGVKDFRFLCPNGTAFDQEAQICADWGDVDCEQATLYYSSDNFDLYRLGSGFESKRAPAVEDEQPFHLQNAESNDLRRTPQQNSNSQSFNRNNVANYNDDSGSYSSKPNYGNTRNVPKVRSTTTTTTTEASYHADRRGDDEIFKGSHSSNFFNNKNNGKEEDLVDFPQKPQPQRTYTNRGRPRPQSHTRNPFINNNNNIQPFPSKASEQPFEQSTTTTTSTTTYSPPTTPRFRPVPNNQPSFQNNVKTVSLQSSFRTGNSQDNDNSDQGQVYTSSTESVPFQRNNFQQGNGYYKSTTQQRIQPTTYSPPHSPFNVETSSTSNDDFRRYDKTPTTPAQKFKQTPHNSFYNAQFEKEATESYDQIRIQEFSNQPNRTAPVNDVVRTVPKPTHRVNVQQQNTFNERQISFNERQNNFNERQNNFNERQNSFNERQNTFDERPKSFNERPNSFNERQNSFNERQNSFNERQNNPETSPNPEEKPADNFSQPQPKPQRSRRPTHFRGTKNFNRASLDDELSNPLNVRPLEIQTKPSSTTQAPNRFEQNNNSGFSINFRPSPRPSQPTTPNGYSTPTAFEVPDVNRAAPSPFSLPPEQQQVKQGPIVNNTQQENNDYFAKTPFQTLPTFNESPRGFSLNPPFKNQNFGQSRAPNTTPKSSSPKKYEEQPFDNYTPSSQTKKFSTLVPKDQFYPTTFKPATYKKVIQGYDQKLGTSTKFAASSYLPSTSTTTYRPQPASDQGDEDDGQYHPELYEKDFARNKLKSRKQQQRPSYDRNFDRRPSEAPTDTEDDEFLNTAHSLNIAAGANQLRAEKTKQSSPTAFRTPTTSYVSATTTTTTKRPISPPKNKQSSKKNHKGANEDTSYDYAYYDSFSGNPQDYEYDLISEFGKTRKH